MTKAILSLYADTEKDFRRMIKTTPSGFRLQTSDFIFALQSLQLTVLQFLKTIFLRYSLTVDSFGKEKNREDSVIVPTHYLLLEILPILCK